MLQRSLLTAPSTNSASLSLSTSTLFSTPVIYSGGFRNRNQRFSFSPPSSPSLDCIRCSISQSPAMEMKPESKKNDEVLSNCSLLSVRPYVAPSWASHLNPIPTHFSSLAQVSSLFPISFPACLLAIIASLRTLL